MIDSDSESKKSIPDNDNKKSIAPLFLQQTVGHQHRSSESSVSKKDTKGTAEGRAERPSQGTGESPSKRTGECFPKKTGESPSLIDKWKKLELEMICEICGEILDAPVSLKCMHAFCSFCIRRHLEFQPNSSAGCPTCKVPASYTDLRGEKRLALMISILREDNFRKSIRQQLRIDEIKTHTHPSKNPTFIKQNTLESLFKTPGTLIVREPLPFYKSMKEKDVKNLFIKDGLSYDLRWSLEEAVRKHKEFILFLQGFVDASKMGVYKFPPTREGASKYWNKENPTSFLKQSKKSEISKAHHFSELVQAAQLSVTENLRNNLVALKERAAFAKLKLTEF